MKSKKNTFVSRAAVGCVTTAIFLLLCIIKGIYPFGIATLDTVDFQSQWIPAYYHVWDVLHGDGSAFFDWRVGGGNNFAGVSAQFSLFSPFNLFFLFVKRSWIEKSMIVFLLIKLLAMGYGMRWFLKEQILKEERYGIYILAGSVGYAVNGYTLLYYGMGWLDVAAILPLLCYFFCRIAGRGLASREKYARLYRLPDAGIPHQYSAGVHDVFFPDRVCGGIFFPETTGPAAKKERHFKIRADFFTVAWNCGGNISAGSEGNAWFLPAVGRGVPGNLRLFSAASAGRNGRGVEMGDSWQRGGSAAVLRHFWQTEAGAHLAVVSGGGDGAAGFLRGGQSHLAPRDVCVLPDAIWLYAGVCRDLYGSGARAGFCGR
jgi:hypothetical protein